MALDVTPIYRNLRTRVTFFGLEAEDLFAILAVAVVMNIAGRFLNREMFGLPMNMVLLRSLDILGIYWGGWVQRHPAANRANMTEIVRWFAEGKLSACMHDAYPLEQAAHALHLIAGRKVMGKVILRP